MPNDFLYNPLATEARQANLAAPLIPEPAPLHIAAPLAGLFQNVGNIVDEKRQKQLEEAQLEIDANKGNRTQEQMDATIFEGSLLTRHDLTRLEINNASQRWGAQHLIDINKYANLSPEDYNAMLAQEAATLKDKSRDAEYMSQNLNRERATLTAAHAKANAEYVTTSTVSQYQDMIQTWIAKAQAVGQSVPAIQEQANNEVFNNLADLLGNPAHGYLAHIAINQMVTGSLQNGDPTIYEAMQQGSKKGIIPKENITSIPGLAEAKQKFSAKLSADVMLATKAIMEAQAEHREYGELDKYLKHKMAIALTTDIPLSPEATALMEDSVKALEANPAHVKARDEKHYNDTLQTIFAHMHSIEGELNQATGEEGKAKFATTAARLEDYMNTVLKQGGLTKEDMEKVTQTGSAILINSSSKRTTAELETKIAPILDQMKLQSPGELLTSTNKVREIVQQAPLSKASKQQIVSEYIRKVGNATMLRVKELTTDALSLAETGNTAEATAQLKEVATLFTNNIALPESAPKTWRNDVLKLIRQNIKHHTPALGEDLLTLLAKQTGDIPIAPTAAVLAANADEKTAPAAHERQIAVTKVAPLLQTIAGTSTEPKTEKEAYAAVVPPENVQAFLAAPDINYYASARKYGADPDKARKIYTAINNGRTAPEQATAFDAINTTAQALDGWQPGTHVSNRIWDGPTDVATLKKGMLPAEHEAYAQMSTVMPGAVADQLKKQAATIWGTDWLINFIGETNRTGAGEAKNNAVLKLLTNDIPGQTEQDKTSSFTYTNIKLLGVPEATAQEIRIRAIIKASAGGPLPPLPDKGEHNVYTVNINGANTAVTSAQWVQNQAQYKAAAPADQQELLQFFEIAKQYGEDPIKQLNLATTAMDKITPTIQGFRIRGNEEFMKEFKPAPNNSINSIGALLKTKVVQRYLQGIAPPQASANNQELIGSSMVWVYNPETKNIVGTGYGKQIAIPRTVWAPLRDYNLISDPLASSPVEYMYYGPLN